MSDDEQPQGGNEPGSNGTGDAESGKDSSQSTGQQDSDKSPSGQQADDSGPELTAEQQKLIQGLSATDLAKYNRQVRKTVTENHSFREQRREMDATAEANAKADAEAKVEAERKLAEAGQFKELHTTAVKERDAALNELEALKTASGKWENAAVKLNESVGSAVDRELSSLDDNQRKMIEADPDWPDAGSVDEMTPDSVMIGIRRLGKISHYREAIFNAMGVPNGGSRFKANPDGKENGDGVGPRNPIPTTPGTERHSSRFARSAIPR